MQQIYIVFDIKTRHRSIGRPSIVAYGQGQERQYGGGGRGGGGRGGGRGEGRRGGGRGSFRGGGRGAPFNRSGGRGGGRAWENRAPTDGHNTSTGWIEERPNTGSGGGGGGGGYNNSGGRGGGNRSWETRERAPADRNTSSRGRNNNKSTGWIEERPNATAATNAYTTRETLTNRRQQQTDEWDQSRDRDDIPSNEDYFGDFGSVDEDDRLGGTGEYGSGGEYSNRDRGSSSASRWGQGGGGGGSRAGGGGQQGGYARKQSNGPSMRDLFEGDVVYGVSPVLAALEAGRRKIHTLYIQEGTDESKRKDKSALQTATTRARELGAKVVVASKHDLNMVSDNRPHQGLILDASVIDFESLETMPAAESVWEGTESGAAPPIWLCLDEVMDPQNFGAALRSAFFLGASGVLTCRRNSSPLSGTVSKASAGAMEVMPVHACRSLPQTLADAKEKGWIIIGAAAESSAISCASFTPDKPTILVMGNEGHGLRTTVRRLCDVTLRIAGAPTAGASALGLGGLGGERMQHAKSVVDSLNVSVATGILLHQLLAKSDVAIAE